MTRSPLAFDEDQDYNVVPLEEKTMLKKPDLNKPVFALMPAAKQLVMDNKCPLCRGPIVETDFKDEGSKREYSISGMCQTCQDRMFG